MKPLPLLFPFLLFVSTATAAPAAADAQATAERMLAALGGRAAWAATANTINDSQQNWDGDPHIVRVVITMDFERLRLKIDTRAEGLHVVRVIDGERHWRIARDGTVGPVSEQVLDVDRKFWQRHVYRTLHRIAKRDPAITLAIGSEGRLEVREGATRIAWYLLDRGGQPYRYGAHDDDTGAIFGPWEAKSGGIHHPLWVTRDGGKWRAMLKRLETNVRLDDSAFAPPGK